MRRIILAAALAAALAFAGCLSDDGADTTPDTTPSPASTSPEPTTGAEPGGADGAAPDSNATAAPRVVVTSFNGTITGIGVGASTDTVDACCVTARVQGESEGAFTPETNITAIVVELAWESPFDLDLMVRGPDFESVFPPTVNESGVYGSRGHLWTSSEGQAGAPDGRAVVRIVDADSLALEGEWGWTVTTKTAHAVAYTVHVSLFYGKLPEESYSAAAP